jgi:hypothetical protein
MVLFYIVLGLLAEKRRVHHHSVSIITLAICRDAIGTLKAMGTFSAFSAQMLH